MHCMNHWIPAYAGMTEGRGQEYGRNDKGAIGMATNSLYPSVVIPAQAGIHDCMDIRLHPCRRAFARMTARAIDRS